ncbi:MAG: ComEA family DNA-binding protein [Candidatus Eremiobacteraeota bacterium]|nr:ComEA family DNA-binding protein [Candidatus Eremiobacteraeota bacterium]
MNLRLPIVAGVFVTAAVAAALRGGRPAARSAPLTIVTAPSTSPLPAFVRTAHRRVDIAGRSGTARAILVYVAGAVVRAGVYTLPATARGVDALHAAGGVTSGADTVAVNLAKPLIDGEELAFPLKSAERSGLPRARMRSARATPATHERPAKRRRKRAASASGDESAGGVPNEVIDVNSADENTLETLPGIGAALAERIALVRQQSGPFASLDDLLDVNGMTQTKLDAIAPYVTVR